MSILKRSFIPATALACVLAGPTVGLFAQAATGTRAARSPTTTPKTGTNSQLFQVNPALLNPAQNLANTALFSYSGFSLPPGYNPYATTAGLGLYGSSSPYVSLANNPYAISPSAAYPSSANPSPAAPSTPPYSSTPYSSYYDPDGGYFRGVGDLVKSLGKYELDVQKARLLNQQVEQAKIETRRRLFDERRSERNSMPTAEDVRQSRHAIALRAARAQPQTSDILSARSLNDLLAHLKVMHGKSQRGATLLLDEDVLKKINVKTDFGGNIGLFRNGGRLLWPSPLRATAFAELRNAFESHVENAIDRVKVDGRTIAALVTRLQNELRGMSDLLEKTASSLSTGQYIDARRYLDLLGDALRALQDPNVGNYFTRKYEARGKTVADLVDHMSKEGLTFAAAVPGDEGAYRALQSCLAAYDASVTRLGRR